MTKSAPGRRIGGVTDRPYFDLESWPTPEVGALSTKARADYKLRKQAVELCVDGASDKTIKEACQIGLRQTLRLITERCAIPHPDGRIYGFRGLIKHLRINPSVRRKPVCIDEAGRGGTLAMTSLLAIDPEFHRLLDARIGKNRTTLHVQEVKRPRLSLYRWFLDELRRRGYETRQEWPFGPHSATTMNPGYGALNRYVDRFLLANPRAQAREKGGESLERKLKSGDGVDRPVVRPFERVEMDAHKLDGIFCVLVPDTNGGHVPRIIHRLWVIVIIEIITRAVLGYYLSLNREVRHDDVLRALKCALSKWKPLQITFSEEPLADGAGLPSVLGDSFVGICWDETSVDGALAETCKAVKERLAEVVGSRLVEPGNSFSARRSLDDRPFIETFFRTLGDRALQRLSNSTGPRPQDRKVSKPHDIATASQFQYEYLQELLQTLIANYNATPHSGLQWRSPLSMLQYLHDRGKLPGRRADPELVQGMLSVSKLCTVKGSATEGRHPYVNGFGARYGGPSIRDRYDLVGTKVWITAHLEDDARFVKCATTSGQHIAVLRAAPPWHNLPHSLAVRRSIMSFRSTRKDFVLGTDGVQSFISFVQKQRKGKLPPHPAYIEAMRVIEMSAELFQGDKAITRALESIAADGQKDEKKLKSAASSQDPQDLTASPKDFRKTSVGYKKPLPMKRLASN